MAEQEESLEYYKQKAQKLSEDLEMFAHITSHDLKDPLRQALIYFEKLQKYCSTDAESKMITAAEEEVTSTIKRIELLRELSYIVNSPDKKIEDIDFNRVLEEAKEQLQDVIKENKATISSDTLPVVVGNKAQITKLFTSLLDNAIKFRSDKDPKVDIHMKEDGNMWQFSIADNGMGLDPVYRKLVFALFQRVDPMSEKEGFGAGLAFAQKIVTNHGGEIWFESDGEHGTIFYFTLPKDR